MPICRTRCPDAHRAGQHREGDPDARGRGRPAARAGALGDGQESSAYTTLNTGPKRPGDLDGPEHYHVVILDNGRSSVLGTEMQDMLRCIRCGACMNHCPVYGAIGGHAYGWVYPGPIGAVLTPQLLASRRPRSAQRLDLLRPLRERLPVRIPLPGLMRHWREREFERHLTPARVRQGLALWSFAPAGQRLYKGLAGPGQSPAAPVRTGRRAATAPCRWPAAGRASATSRAAAGRHVPCAVGARRLSDAP
jgi:L-lactate utilization protein LutB